MSVGEKRAASQDIFKDNTPVLPKAAQRRAMSKFPIPHLDQKMLFTHPAPLPYVETNPMLPILPLFLCRVRLF